jgi:hypothetical protein
MTSFRERTRFATVVAVGLALVVSGVVAGAAGGNFILGAANSAGTANTSLTTSSTGNALLVTQNGTGTAIRGSTGSGTGIAGFFTSGSGAGVSGVVANGSKYGVYAANDSASSSGGAALRASGQQNEGVVATSAEDNAIVGTSTGCTGFLCGSYGVNGTGSGFAAGVHGDGTGSLFGVYGDNGLVAGVYGFGSAEAPGVQGLADFHGVYGVSGSAQTIDTSCGPATGFFGCAGGAFTGSQNGAIVMGNGDNGYSALGTEDVSCDFSTSPPTSCGLRAFIARGHATVDGDLTVTGAKTGYVADYAVNGSDVTLRQGDAVTLIGVKAAEVGAIPLLVVAPAKAGDTVIGVVDRMMKPAPKTATIDAQTNTITGPNGDKQTTKIPAKTVKAEGGGIGFVEGGTAVKPGERLLVVTLGAFAYGSADAAGGAIKAGDELMAGAKAGKLVKAEKVTVDGKTFSIPGTSAGYALGSLNDGTGRIGIFVSPH